MDKLKNIIKNIGDNTAILIYKKDLTAILFLNKKSITPSYLEDSVEVVDYNEHYDRLEVDQY